MKCWHSVGLQAVLRAQVHVKPGKLLIDWFEWARTTFQPMDIPAFHTVLPPTSHILHGRGLAMEEWAAASNDVEQSFYLFPSVSAEESMAPGK